MCQINQDYEILLQIGAGTFSAVYKAKRKSDGLIVAIKMIEAQSENEVNLIYNEVEVLKHLMGGHSSIPDIYDFFSEGPVFFIIMEYLDGFITLLEWTNTYAPLIFSGTQSSEDIQGLIKTREIYISSILKQIISSLNFIHQKSVVHRDLKLENIMICPKNVTIKIIDFGFSLISESMAWSTICGSFEYLAPEVLRDLVEKPNCRSNEDRSPYSLQSEVWSVGIILYGMVFCRLPFTHQNRIKLIHMVLNSQPTFCPENLIVDQDLKSLLTEMLEKDPSIRINFNQVPRHPFLSDNKVSTNVQFRKYNRCQTQINKLAYAFKSVTKPDLNTDNSESDTEKDTNKLSDNNTKKKAKIDSNVSLKCLPLSYRMNYAQLHLRCPKYTKSLRIGAKIIAPKVMAYS